MKQKTALPVFALVLGAASGALWAATAPKLVPASAAKLEALLPGKIDGFSRITAKSQCCGIPGMVESYATGFYRGHAGTFKLKLTDMGNMSGMLMLLYVQPNVDDSDGSYSHYVKFANGKDVLVLHHGAKDLPPPQRGNAAEYVIAKRYVIQAAGKTSIGVLRRVVNQVTRKAKASLALPLTKGS
ncbi:MAG: hypothetical protein KGI84_06985 [Elusimicrobia bacterium]|nr:hypothetical protein [Elusimicrobiota bacterium]